MAGVKITDLGTLTTAVDADLLYIVDVSDTSQSPQGTSKQIEVGNMFSSGTYTPTFSAEVDCTLTAIKGYYIRVGNMVTCNVNVNAQGPGVFPTTYEFEMTPPIATDFAFATDAIGLVTESTFLISNIFLDAISATNNIRVSFGLPTSAAFNLIMSIQFQYEVL
jgi:hypothetical protein